MEAAGLLAAQNSETAEVADEADSQSDRHMVTIISTRTGRRTSIHHDTDFADRMNAYIVSPLIPLPKPRLPHQLQPQQPQQTQQRKQQRAKQPRAAHRSVSCPEPATSSSASSADSQRQSPLPHQSFFQPHQRQLSGQHRRKQAGRNPTLERLLQPSAREMSRSEQLLDKMRNLKLRIQRHAVQTNCGNVSVTDWPPPPDVLLAHAPPPVQRATPTSPTSAAESGGADGGGIVCSDSDIRSIIASIQQFEKSVQQNQLAQLIEVISLPSESPLPPCLTSSPNRQPRQSVVRKQVCFIDPKQNRLVMPHHLTAASTAAEAPLASPSSPGQSPTNATQQQQRRSPPPPQSPSPPPTSNSSPGGSLCDASHHCCGGLLNAAGPSGVLSQTSPPPPPPKDVSYDENGQTWDVYGADIDPDLLGQAIQTHLAVRSNGEGSSETAVLQSVADAPPVDPASSNSQNRIQPSSAVSLLCCAGGRN